MTDLMKMSEMAKLLDTDFAIDDENENIYETLTRYFMGREDFDPFKIVGNKASLKKGLLLAGLTGVGKTYAMKIFSELSKGSNKFFIPISSMKFVQAFDKGGFEAIGVGSDLTEIRDKKYRDGTRFCFDDLGSERLGNYQTEVMQHVLEDKIEKWEETGQIFHITTNFTIGELGERYGKRIESRLYQVFNIISFTGRDRRIEL